MRPGTRPALTAVLLALCCAVTARADLISFDFGGTVNLVTGDPFGDFAELSVGDAWSASYVVDEDARDIAAGGLTGLYAIEYAVFEVGSGSVVVDSGYIRVSLSSNSVAFEAADGPENLWTAGIVDFWGPASVLEDDDLPTDVDLWAFPLNDMGFGMGGSGEQGPWFGIDGTIEWMAISVVPGPASILPLLLLALGRRWRRRDGGTGGRR